MIELEVKFDAARMEASLLAAVGTEARARATATALTRIAYAARAHVIAKMPDLFNKPTPFTLHSVRYGGATPDALAAKVYISDDANRGLSPRKYLGPEMRGGIRNNKGAENVLQRAGLMQPGQYIMPSKQFPLDRFGNVPGSAMVRILSRVAAFAEVGSQANASPETKQRLAKRRRAVASTGTDFFVAHEKRGGEPLGIWQLVGRGEVRPVLIFANKRPVYSVRFPMADIVAEFARTHFRDAMIQALLEEASRWTG